MSDENINLKAVYVTRESKKGTIYHAIDIYYGETFILTAFVDKTQASLIDLVSKTQLSSPYTTD